MLTKLDRVDMRRTAVLPYERRRGNRMSGKALSDDSAPRKAGGDGVRALTGLGHGLGLVITAEGIEQSDQRDALLKQGCERGQGFLFGRAIPAHETQDCLNMTDQQKPASIVDLASPQGRIRV